MFVMAFRLTALVASFLQVVLATPLRSPELAKRCTGTIYSLSDVSNAVMCTTVNIQAFTVPAGSQLNLALLDGTTVNLEGDITFDKSTIKKPLFQISGNSITFNGNGHKLDGRGPLYWDGRGGAGGITKPSPMMEITMSGTFSNTEVFNSPANAIGVSSRGPLVITGVTIDNSQGDHPNSRSYGLPAGHNTDGFDCTSTDLTIQNCTVRNQDDCIAINEGSNITFQNNLCSGGHGISIGSIGSGVTVSGIVIKDNTIVNSDQALRIKTDASAYGSTVKGVTYSGNHGTGLKRFGVLIDQSYPKVLGTAGTGVKISDVNFIGSINTLSVNSSATPVAINCGHGACTGSWIWTSLQTSGGTGASVIHAAPALDGYV